MNPSSSVFRVLLLSDAVSHTDEFVQTWAKLQDPLNLQAPLEPVHFRLSQQSFQLLHCLCLLDRIRASFFHAVLVLPPVLSNLEDVSSCATVVRDSSSCPAELFTGSHWEFCFWCAQQAFLCRKCHVVLVFPDERSTDRSFSFWSFKESQSLERLTGAHRGAFFSCELAKASSCDAWACLTNITGLHSSLYSGSPSFEESPKGQIYVGPLLQYCSCVSPQFSQQLSRSPLSSGFWESCLRAVFGNVSPSTLREGVAGSGESMPPAHEFATEAEGSCVSLALSGLPFSFSRVYVAWRSHSLSHELLVDWVAGDLWKAYLDGQDVFLSAGCILSCWPVTHVSSAIVPPEALPVRKSVPFESVPGCSFFRRCHPRQVSLVAFSKFSKGVSCSKSSGQSFPESSDVTTTFQAEPSSARRASGSSDQCPHPRSCDSNSVQEDGNLCPLVLPIRAHLDQVKALMKGDLYIGRGSMQRGLQRSAFANPYKVCVFGRDSAVRNFERHLSADSSLRSQIVHLSGKRLLCHCLDSQRCHGDILIAEFRRQVPQAYDRQASVQSPASPRILAFLASLREPPESDDDSSADDGAPSKGSGWRGLGAPMLVGAGYTVREVCDGQSLASPGRWTPKDRRYPEHLIWNEVGSRVMNYAREAGTPELLVRLALGQVETDPFPTSAIGAIKGDIVRALSKHRLCLQRSAQDREGVPVDFRFLQLLLKAADDPDVSIGDFARGVRVGPGARLPRLPALCAKNRKWKLAEQNNPDD